MRLFRACAIRGLAFACVALPAPAVALAAQDTFDMSVELGNGYTDNVRYIGPDPVSDQYRVVRLNLPYVRRTPSQRLRLGYRPAYVRYSDTDVLDHDEHRLEFDLDTRPSRKSRLRSRAGFTRTQMRGTPESATDPDLFLTRRSDTDLLLFNVALQREVSARWSWEATLGGSAQLYKPISGVEGSGSDVEDRKQYSGGMHVSRTVSRTSSVGLRYGFQRFDLEDSGEEDAHQFEATYEKRLAERMSLLTALGGFQAEGEGADGRRTGTSAQVTLSHRYETLQLDLSASHAPSAGGALRGTATQTRVGLALSSLGGRQRWRWLAAPYYGRRESSAAGRQAIDAVGIRAELERRFAWRYGVRLGTHWFDQTDRDSVFSGNASFLWYPLGARPIGGRSG